MRPGDLPEIGGYRLLARLGEGGMGEVFLARTPSGRPLALKTVHRELSLEPDFADRFAREIRTNDRVRSPWTVSVVDFSPPGALPQWLATEYVPAPSLGDWVRRHGPLPQPALWCLARELSAALVAVQGVGVVHRDIKPANVLLGPERPFLIDFGIARAVRDPRHTRTGAVIGTPGFLAPEQAVGAVAQGPADVFSLAAVLVYAATGHSPFLTGGEEFSVPAVLYRIVHDEPVLDGVPGALLPLVRECLAKEPAARPTAEEVRARLGAARDGDWSAAAPQALVADAGRREAELRGLMAASEPAAGAPARTGSGPLPPPPPPPPSYAPTPTAGGAGSGTGSGAGWASRRRPVIGAAAGVVALATAVTLAIVLQKGEGEGDRGSSAASPPASTAPSTAASSPVPSAGSLPRTWAGTWSGVGPGTPDADGITRARTGEFAVTVTLNAGAVGEIVGKQVSNVKETTSGRDLGCTEALKLQQIKGDTAVFAAVTSHPTDRSASLNCPQGNLYVLKMESADRLTLESEGAQSAGAPAALARTP
ncbi:serine/threonine-protein kinase [Streptomyces vinaceus]|uniref:serine/threonine-protein kinase n=1 Tax=Streptomyces vinaceus TaxID=1960 RepID=UPI003690E359